MEVKNSLVRPLRVVETALSRQARRMRHRDSQYRNAFEFSIGMENDPMVIRDRMRINPAAELTYQAARGMRRVVRKLE
jgi:hypothetical protein